MQPHTTYKHTYSHTYTQIHTHTITHTHKHEISYTAPAALSTVTDNRLPKPDADTTTCKQTYKHTYKHTYTHKHDIFQIINFADKRFIRKALSLWAFLVKSFVLTCSSCLNSCRQGPVYISELIR